MATKYRMLALDVDGTLVAPDDVVAPEVRRAVRDAQRAGLQVVLATGRSYTETMPIWRQLELAGPPAPMVLIGGALVSEPDTGRTLYQKAMPKPIATAFADALVEAGHSAMAIVDQWRWGVDYYWTTGGDEVEAQRKWFEKMDVRVRRVARLIDDPDMPDALRVSAVVDPAVAPELADTLRRRFDGQLNVHAIIAPNYAVMIVEAHAAEANKETALRYVAQGYGIGPALVAAVGDDINDVPMLRWAGLSAAMPHAPRALLASADLVAEQGLAAFVHDLVDGRYDG